jgi:hypothetical protein
MRGGGQSARRAVSPDRRGESAPEVPVSGPDENRRVSQPPGGAADRVVVVMGNPHDALFKRIFQDPKTAEGELRTVLPAEIVERVDWATLEVRPGSFVDRRFRELHTELLYAVRLQEREVLFYVLMEHQSSSDPMMAWRAAGMR